jgi:D-beta-D-heptose 7-phosphate kinase/D-beta-D-heptose 1-phosphate adenosyltransferase
MRKILDRQTLLTARAEWRAEDRVVVFTNGCFDILHRGHIHLFREAKALGDILVVAVNDDASVRKLKGKSRPVFPQTERLEVLEAVEFIDALVSFSEKTPRSIIASVLPDVLVKGGDWKLEEVVGRKEVEQAGGKTVVIPFLAGFSSSNLISKIGRRP